MQQKLYFSLQRLAETCFGYEADQVQQHKSLTLQEHANLPQKELKDIQQLAQGHLYDDAKVPPLVYQPVCSSMYECTAEMNKSLRMSSGHMGHDCSHLSLALVWLCYVLVL